jgi:hypothetical protein
MKGSQTGDPLPFDRSGDRRLPFVAMMIWRSLFQRGRE